MNTFYNYLYYYQNALQTPSLNTGFKRRLYSMHAAHPLRTHGALEDPTALPQRLHSALSNMEWKRQAATFVLSMFKINATAWRFWRLHSVFTSFPQRCWLLHSAHLGDLQLFEIAVETLWGRRSGVTELQCLGWGSFDVNLTLFVQI